MDMARRVAEAAEAHERQQAAAAQVAARLGAAPATVAGAQRWPGRGERAERMEARREGGGSEGGVWP
eukprot:501390-Prymnesium_polylepis.1